MDDLQGHLIRVVARKTGLTSHVIRVWEKRYGAVSPTRTPTNRRLYSDLDVARLQLLRRATLTGHSIGQIARLPTERLRALVAADEMIAPSLPRPASAWLADATPQAILQVCLEAIERLDAAALEEILARATVLLSQPVLLEQLIVPLMYSVGELWHQGTLRIAHEHLASAVVRTALGSLSRGFGPVTSAPSLVVTTPSGHLHELGGMIVAAVAASDGWRVIYLGPSLPAEEIAAAAAQTRARAVALSIIYPGDDPFLRGELIKLRQGLVDEVVLLVGGQASDVYGDVLDQIGAVWLQDLADLRKQLESLRSRQPQSPQVW